MSKFSSSLSSNFSASISKSMQGKSFDYNQLPKKLLCYLESGEKMCNLKVLVSPLQVIKKADEEITSTVIQLIKNPKKLAISPVSLYLAGLSLLATKQITTISTFLIQHHEIIFQIKGVYVVLSLCEDGLEHITGIDDQDLINRRKDNKISKEYEIEFDSRKLASFLKENQSRPYHLLNWNCQHFVAQLIKALH